MKQLLSATLRLTAIAALNYWRVWLMSGVAYYYTVERASLWESLTSSVGITLMAVVCGFFSSLISDSLQAKHHW